MKTVLVTGSTDGIGKATAKALARLGCQVIVHGPDDARARCVQRDLISATANPDIQAVSADFSSLAQVRELAQEISSLPRLDVLINNAGIATNHRTLTEDGFESTFGINHLAPFLLTNLLLDLLQDSAPARIVNVSSSVHKRGRMDLGDLQMTRHFSGWDAYCNSKLANALFTCELARRLDSSRVTANFLHPGAVATKLLHVFRDGGSTVESGAETPVHLALAPEVARVSGHYFVNRQLTPASSTVDDRRLAAELWRASSKHTGLET